MFGLQFLGHFTAQAAKQFAPSAVSLLALVFGVALLLLTASNGRNNVFVGCFILQVLRFCHFEVFKGGHNRVWGCLAHWYNSVSVKVESFCKLSHNVSINARCTIPHTTHSAHQAKKAIKIIVL
ncbi:hypothetical protein EFV60_07250 [Yersinia enterocolitica]|nr:hypothetical protein [Yersinia enterocolitica]